MTHKGESVTLKGETTEAAALSGEDAIWHYRNLFIVTGDDFIKRSHDFAGTGRVAEFFSRGVYFRHTSGSFPEQASLVLEQDAPCLNMTFCISNGRHYRTTSSAKPLATLRQHQHNLLLLPKQKVLVEWPQEEKTEFFDIFISTDSFFRYLPQSHPLSQRFRKALEQNSLAILSRQSLPLTPRIITLLYELLNCQFSGHCKCLFAEAKVVELLALQLDQQDQAELKAQQEELREEDVLKMQLAKNLLLANLESPFTLKELAHKVGTNEYTLKKHFKEVFGNTVYGYLHQHKMELARELLLQGEAKIAEVAHLMGYKHATHFTSAFKKHFGFAPHKLKRS